MWYSNNIVSAATKYWLNPLVVQAIVMSESSGQTDAFRYEPAFWRRYLQHNSRWAGENPRRVSSSYGLMQIMYPVAVERGFAGIPEQLFVPDVGLRWGCKHLAWLQSWTNSFKGASESDRFDAMLAAYNGGKGGNRPGSPLRNAAYVSRVKSRMTRIHTRNA